jgi:hypothetical protein
MDQAWAAHEERPTALGSRKGGHRLAAFGSVARHRPRRLGREFFQTIHKILQQRRRRIVAQAARSAANRHELVGRDVRRIPIRSSAANDGRKRGNPHKRRRGQSIEPISIASNSASQRVNDKARVVAIHSADPPTLDPVPVGAVGVLFPAPQRRCQSPNPAPRSGV